MDVDQLDKELVDPGLLGDANGDGVTGNRLPPALSFDSASDILPTPSLTLLVGSPLDDDFILLLNSIGV